MRCLGSCNRTTSICGINSVVCTLAASSRCRDIPSYGNRAIAYNHVDFNVLHPAVSDRVVRQALRLALNRPELLAKVGRGIGVVQDSATPLNAPYYMDLGTTPYDPAKAKRRYHWHSMRRGGSVWCAMAFSARRTA